MNDEYQPPNEADFDLADGPDWWAFGAAMLVAAGGAAALVAYFATRK